MSNSSAVITTFLARVTHCYQLLVGALSLKSCEQFTRFLSAQDWPAKLEDNERFRQVLILAKRRISRMKTPGSRSLLDHGFEMRFASP